MKACNIPYLLIFGLLLSMSAPGFAAVPTDDGHLAIERYWLEDAGAKLTPLEALASFERGEGLALQSSVFRLGAQETRIWILLAARSQSSETLSRRLLAGIPHSRYLRASLFDPGNAEPRGRILLDEHRNKPYARRNNAYRLLNSDDFRIDPGQAVRILVQADVRGPSYLPLSLLSPEQFQQMRLNDAVFATAFYVFEATLGTLFLLFAAAIKHRIAILYAVMFLLGLLAMADIDGHAFRWLWPEHPSWNSWSPMVVLPALNTLGFAIIYLLLQAIESAALARLKPVALVFAALSLLLPALLPWLPFSTLVQSENALTLLVFILQPVAFAAWTKLGRRNRVSWLALLVVAAAIGGLLVTVFVDLELPAMLSEHLHHLAYLLVGSMIMIVITAQLMGLRKDREIAAARELNFAKRDAELNQALFKAEQNYSKARDLASRRQRQLAGASHDIRQPIAALRAGIDAVANRQDPGTRRQLHEAFDYLEKLCRHYLSETRSVAPEAQAPDEAMETYPVSLILGTVRRMFAEEAASRGVELRTVDCGLSLQVPPLVLMRIVSNLTANAVKHHPGGENAKVLLGCRRKSHGLVICVVDNGAGMTAETLSEVRHAYQKGADSAGEGLGLAIVRQLAAEIGVEIRMRSTYGSGSYFGVEVPLATARATGPDR